MAPSKLLTIAAFLLLTIGAGCASPPPSTTKQPAPPIFPSSIQTRAEFPSAVMPECIVEATSLRIRLDAGQAIPTGTGLTITNEGTSYDNFGPAGFDLQMSLLFQRGNEEARHRPSLQDRRPQEVLGHCYRLVDAAPGVVLIDVSVLPALGKEVGDEPPAGAITSDP